MNHIEKTKYLLSVGKVAIMNPAYLSVMPTQHEKSMLGQRTGFLAFHRFIYNLKDQDIYKLWDAYKNAFVQASKDFPDEICCDLSLMRDALQFQIAIRDDKQADPAIAEEIAISFHQNAKIAKEFEEITSEYLIGIVKEWLS
ncbi:hypothetical protein ACQE3E_06725 [Methylomonas sp. MED-D]|uniref:hypothetical protein n=1 Tax=Methylomonas sp. MED-D TaxID=3418768 RepID=UPI003CFF3717